MKITFEVRPGLTLEHEAPGTKQAFATIAYWQTVFGVQKCGNCQSPNVRLDYRKPQGYDYYQVHCNDCKYEFKFGQRQETGELYPKGWDPPFQKNDAGEGRQQTRQEPEYHAPPPPPQQASPPSPSGGIPF